jgi:hypothetical protein
MLELLLFFGCGYLFSSLTRNKFYVDLRNADKVLSWDTTILAWRPVYDKSRLEVGRKYLAAFELLKEED